MDNTSFQVNNSLCSDGGSSAGFMDKNRRRAYRNILAGIRYHSDEKLSFVTFGFKRGSVIDHRTVIKQMMLWIRRQRDFRTDYFRASVEENNSPDAKWRLHIHMIWNAPYIKQTAILEKLELYIGEQGSVFIKLLDGHPKRSARYLMQYLGNQYGNVTYTMSRNWLPKGYNRVLSEVKHDYYRNVPRYFRKSLDNADSVFKLLTQGSEDWRRAVLIDGMNSWVDEQRNENKSYQSLIEGENL